MSVNNILFILLIIWGIPSSYFRSQFRKMVYQTNDWKINFKPVFKKELIGLLGNIDPANKDYLKIRNHYRTYLAVYLLLFIIYRLVD